MSAAMMELGAIVGPEKADELKAWWTRWIDEGVVLVAMSPLDELQARDEKTRAEMFARRGEAHALTLGRMMMQRPGALAISTPARRPDGWVESRIGLCLVRAEPKRAGSSLPGWPGKCNAPEPGLGYPCAYEPGHLELGLPHATISGRQWREGDARAVYPDDELPEAR